MRIAARLNRITSRVLFAVLLVKRVTIRRNSSNDHVPIRWVIAPKNGSFMDSNDLCRPVMTRVTHHYCGANIQFKGAISFLELNKHFNRSRGSENILFRGEIRIIPPKEQEGRQHHAGGYKDDQSNLHFFRERRGLATQPVVIIV